MTYYEHRRLVPPSIIFFAVSLIGPGVLVYRDALGQWWEAWPVHLVVGTVLVLWWVGIARYANRHVRVDETGLWIDGELAVAAEDIRWVGTIGDGLYGHLTEVGSTALPRPRNHPTRHRTVWSQHNWARVIRAPDLGELAVATRARDQARGSWLDGVVVFTDAWYGRGMREAWLLCTYRPTKLSEALLRAAPQVETLVTRAASARNVGTPEIAAPDLDDQPG